MTEAAKAKIIIMKNKGLRPVDIERETGIPRETVKTFCKRHYSPIILPAAEDHICVACGKRFEYGKRRTKYCSAECHQKWWNTHSEMVKKKAFYFQTCQFCGEKFAAYGNQHRKYCSHECYIKDRFKNGGKHGKASKNAEPEAETADE